MYTINLLVSVLPGVNAEKGLVLANNGVLVGVSADTDLAGLLVLDEPGPAAALNTSQRGVELVLELVEATVGAIDGLSEGAGGGLTTAGALGSQVLPEKGVVQVTTAVEVDRRLQGNLGGDVTLGLSLLELLNGVVVVGDIGVVVVLVVDLHDLAGDGGLKGAIVVCDLGQWAAAYCAVLTGVNPNTPKHRSLQDRSGRVALPRAKVKPAAPALKEAEAPERRATRAVVERRATIVCTGF